MPSNTTPSTSSSSPIPSSQLPMPLIRNPNKTAPWPPPVTAQPAAPPWDAAATHEGPDRSREQTIRNPEWMRANRSGLQRQCDPAAFRTQLRIRPKQTLNQKQKGEPAATLGRLAEPFQAAAFAAIDPAWTQLMGLPAPVDRAHANVPAALRVAGSSVRRRFWIERPRGHSKTTDTAAMLLWVLAYSRRMLRGVAAAADRDQARLVLDQIAYLLSLNPWLRRRVSVNRDRAIARRSGSRLEIVSSDAASSYGTIADFIVCDELCHWEQPGLWHSLYTAAAKQPHTVLAVLTNAGSGRDWRWTARETARLSPAWFFSTLDGPQASWIDAAFLDEQRRSLPESVFNRLWLNQWQDRAGGFLRPDEVRRCRDASLTMQETGQPGRTYLAAIDYAEKHDRTAAIVCHLQPATVEHPRVRVVVDRLDVVSPQPDEPTHPRFWYSVLTVLVLAFAGLSIGTLVIASIREHANV